MRWYSPALSPPTARALHVQPHANTVKFFGGAIALALSLVCTAAQATNHSKTSAQTATWPQEAPIETIYNNGLMNKWTDYGWAPRDTRAGSSARINFSDLGGWTLGKSNLSGSTYSALIFNILAPNKFGDFLEVYLGADNDDTFPHIRIDAAHRHVYTGGWATVRVAIQELNPKGAAFDRVTIRAIKEVDSTWVEISQFALAAPGSSNGFAPVANYASRQVGMQLNCAQPTHPISPLIYGTAYNFRKNTQDTYQWDLGMTTRRWGGNPATRYNWRIGNAWNTASDWYFMNVNYTGIANYSWRMFLDENRAHTVGAALTVPTIGWVAKDTTSYAFPVSVYGKQANHFSYNHDIGNGHLANGKRVEHPDPRRTSIPASPEYVSDWVQAIKRYDESHAGARSINVYYLDNEPMLWNTTHYDVHATPVGYDELLKRTLDYGTLIRRVDPEAKLAGPASWGWPAYFFSAVDAQAGFEAKPDRKAHGDTPLLAWYLQQMRQNEAQNGVRLLDYLDVHFYPEGRNIRGPHEKNDADTAARRIRATRSLWDPNYQDESWINDRIALIPRLRSLIQDNYPNTGISIGEYNFGGEKHMSGALAQAEALGRFGQQSVDIAYYWTYPAKDSYPYHAFRLFRNYDGQGAHFLENSLSTTDAPNASFFASTDAKNKQIVAVILNTDPTQGAEATINLVGCGRVQVGRSFQLAADGKGIVPIEAKAYTDQQSVVRQTLPPYSITVIELSADRKNVTFAPDTTDTAR